MILIWNLRLAGFFLIVLGIAHIYFPRRFGWIEETKSLSLLAREIFFVHNAYIGFFVFLNGLLCIVDAPDLAAHSRLSVHILLGLSLFWLSRGYVQLFVYSPNNWKGKLFETRMNILFVLFWLYLGATFALPAVFKF